MLHRALQVVHLQYRSRLEAGVRHYLGTEISELRAPEAEVFDIGCPTRDEAVVRGYRGDCRSQSEDRSAAPLHLAWTVLAR